MSTITTKTISPRELQNKHEAGESVKLIDVRTPVEFRETHVEFAHNEPLDQVDPSGVVEKHECSDQPLYVMCRSGNRAQQAIDKFHKAGYENVINVDGGMLKWEEEGQPVIRGKKAISLERQVRIVAGSIVFIGAMLGYFVNPAWVFLSAFIGAGLVFAGITDTCGMGMMLAKMPWNQIKDQNCKIK
jgi:rhodanese-related sulfurtransferase